MVKENTSQYCCAATGKSIACCQLESLISIDERGQMVLPKYIREKANIRAGDKLAVISWEKEGKVCCLALIKAEDFAEMVKGLLGPMVKDITAQGGSR